LFSIFANAWRVPDLRKKLLYILLILFIYRIGCHIPLPLIDVNGLLEFQAGGEGQTIFAFLVGGNPGTIMAMGIGPYITASIIMQLLTVAIPKLEQMQKEGEEGRKKINKITRYLSLGLAFAQSVAYFMYIRSQNMLTVNAEGKAYTGFWLFFQAAVVVLSFTAGTAFLIWLGEQVNEKGVGNGISMVLFAGIISRIPSMMTSLYFDMLKGKLYNLFVPLALILLLLSIAFIVWMDNAEHRIPVQYAKRVVGRKMYGGQSSHIPLKVNMSGVLPVIFAGSILSLPPTIQMFVGNKITSGSLLERFFGVFSSDHWFYAIIYFIFIIFFAYFYSAIQYNPIEMANNIRKNSGAIPGIRPGKPTSDYIARIMSKITLLGALLLSVIALYPILFTLITNALGYTVRGIALGGTSIIIMVGVALETVRQLESQMMMRHYKGFLD